jgi:hypothetical protein
VGLKGATGFRKTADVSNAVVSVASNEERSEALDWSLPGLSGCSHSKSFIETRLLFIV